MQCQNHSDLRVAATSMARTEGNCYNNSIELFPSFTEHN